MTLRYLGVPVRNKCYTFGDNESVVNSACAPQAKLQKRHVFLSFNRVREAIAAGIMTFRYIQGKDNPANILTKHWGYQQIWGMMQPLLFWQGDTMDLLNKYGERDSKQDNAMGTTTTMEATRDSQDQILSQCGNIADTLKQKNATPIENAQLYILQAIESQG